MLRSTLTWLRLMLLGAALTLVAGCKEVLYSELTEADANEMIALLVLSGIDAKRQSDAATGYSVIVDEADLAVAVTVLKNAGLPREKFQSLGEVFGDVGFVGTPFEERVLFAHATNQELANTISQIKGVDSARVHVVIPAEERFGKETEPARASVAVFHDRSFEPSEYSSRIKALVAFSVPGLEIENISSTFFLSPGYVVEQSELPPVSAGSGSAMASGIAASGSAGGGAVWGISALGLALFLVILLLVRMVMLGARRVSRKGRDIGGRYA